MKTGPTVLPGVLSAVWAVAVPGWVCAAPIPGEASEQAAQTEGRTEPAATPVRDATRADGSAGRNTDAAAAERREAEFAEMMNGAVFKGTWQTTSGEGMEGKKPLSDAKPESYVIERATKVTGDHWIITARIRFAEKDVTVPVSVRVVWAGDTPIITVDSTNIPMLGAYSARVMVYRNFYAGTWFGKGYGGVLSGQIVKRAKEDEPGDGGSAAGAGSENQGSGSSKPKQ